MSPLGRFAGPVGVVGFEPPGAIPPILSLRLTSILLNKLLEEVAGAFAATFLEGPAGVLALRVVFLGPVGTADR